jgi:uncharacterized protein Smg (DUF494 family)
MRLVGVIHILFRIYKGFALKKIDDVVYGIITFLNTNDIVEMDSRPIHFQIFHPFIFKPMHNDMLTL